MVLAFLPNDLLSTFFIIIIEENFSQYCLFYGLIVFILVFTLIILLQLGKSLFLLCSFAGQKNQKPRHTGRISRHFLCSGISLWEISFSRCVPCRSTLIVCLLGAVELVRLATPYGASNQHSNNHCLRRTSAAFVTSVKKFPLTHLHELSHNLQKSDGV